MQFLLIGKSERKNPVCLSVCLFVTVCLSVCTICLYTDYTDRLSVIYRQSVQSVCIVSAFCPVCTGYQHGRIYFFSFVVTCPDINSVHTRNQFTVVPYHF